MTKLNLEQVRAHFPSLGKEFTFFDNAGGSQVVKHVGDNIIEYLYKSNVQLGASYSVSQLAQQKLNIAQDRWAKAINARFSEEVVFGSSATSLLQNLSRSLVNLLSAGDEVIVTNSDHESNIGPWINMAKAGIKVKIWELNPETFSLDLDDLEKLITTKTRLVAFTHASNILGTINPIKEITKYIHEKGALVCVDGVAYAPHRHIDVKDWDIDFYVFSLYKVYGPHYSLLYAKKDILNKLPGINHFFIDENDIPYKLQPGNINYELTYGCEGILDYIDELYLHHFNDQSLSQNERYRMMSSLFESHEEKLAEPVLNYLNNTDKITIIGEKSADKSLRVPTISFTVENRKSSEIPLFVDKFNIGIRWGDFYAKRLICDLGLEENDGVVRISMVHYNTIDEVNRLIDILKQVI